jgi:hypothetical protein
MNYSFEELKKKKVAELREIAAGLEHDSVKGYTQMNKDHLLGALCTALGIDMYEHHTAKLTGKSKIKSEIKKLKTERTAALSSHNRSGLKNIQRKIHHLKRSLRKTAK